MLKEYEINSCTVALIPLSNFTTKVIETEKVLIVDKTCKEVVNDSCKFFGSSLQGRCDGTKAMVGFNYKAPIIVEETHQIIFFPTHSPRLNECMWFALNYIEDYTEQADNTVVKFKNGQILEVKVSTTSIENQILRATRLESVLLHKIK